MELGSSAARFVLARVKRARGFRVLEQERVQTRLGGGRPGTLPRVAVEETVQTALQQCEQEIERAGAEVQVIVEPVFVRAHAATLQNAIGNLITNALKFSRPGIPPKMTIRGTLRDDIVQISVEDNGIGIAREHHGRIFRVFERLHGVNKFPGTGIGLAMVKKGVERMNGQVGVQSELGKGSRFWVRLPLAHKDRPLSSQA